MTPILPVLTKHHLIEGIQGRGGGHRLCRKPEEYTAGEVLRLTEGDLAPVSCIGSDATPCDRSGECRTLPLWSGLNKVVNAYLDSVTIANLMQVKRRKTAI